MIRVDHPLQALRTLVGASGPDGAL